MMGRSFLSSLDYNTPYAIGYKLFASLFVPYAISSYLPC